jgi:hypothetical protein
VAKDTIIEHTIGEPLYVMASAPIEEYDQLTNLWANVVNAQAAGYVPSGKIRFKNAQGQVAGIFVLSWPTVDLWRLKLDTSSIQFVPGDYSTDIKITAPSGDVVFSQKKIVTMDWGNSR